MSYGGDFGDYYRRAAVLVDKILQRSKAGRPAGQSSASPSTTAQLPSSLVGQPD
jgi:hypothetical protein